MADAFERLKAALADRYRIERELGAGGWPFDKLFDRRWTPLEITLGPLALKSALPVTTLNIAT